MVKLLEVIKKNFKILIRSKSSALIILFGPLLLILLVGTAFNTSAFYDIKVGSYSPNYNELSDSILKKLQQDQYKISKTKSEESCINGVKTGAYHLCIIIPENLTISQEADNTIQVYADQSRMNLVFAIRSAIIDKVGEKSKELSESLTSIVVGQLEETKASLEEKQGVVKILKDSNEQFTSGLVDVETQVTNLDFGDDNILGQFKNKTAELKLQTNDTRTLTEIDDIIKVLEEKIANMQLASDAIANTIPSLKEKAIAESSQLVDLERTSSKIISNVEAIKVRDVETLVSPIKTSMHAVTAEKTHVNYLFPTLIMMVVMFVSLLLSSITVIREKISRAYFRNYISPTKAVLFIAATYLTNILIVVLQLAIVFAVMLFIQPELSSTLLNIGTAVLLITSSFILLGMIVGYIFNSEETSTMGAISLGTILMFFSNTIVPLETLPVSIQKIVDFNMFVASDTILRNIIIFESGLKESLPEIYILLVHIAAFIVIIATIYNVSSKMFNIKRYFHK
ncbi:ABC transporter permease [Candidatus Woesearchaeota archaeon]|nr:ABC transporter permease [Candidatus Woesearchaeota archaeon]